MRIFIDIETAPTADPDTIASIRASIKPPANYTKADTVAAWMADKGEQAALEAISKTALNPEDGSIISIAIATDDHDPVVLDRELSNDSDADLLRAAFRYINDIIEDAALSNPATGAQMFKPEPWWIGHNIAFDLGWLWKRSVIHGITPPFAIPSPDELRHGKNCYCTMTAWAGHRGTISLSRLTRVLGIPDPKANAAGVSGANAWEVRQRGDLDAVRRYNAGDVIACRSVFHRLEGMTNIGRAAA